MNTNRTVKIGFVQYACGCAPPTNRERAAELVQSAAEQGATIVCLPELYCTEYFCIKEDYANFNFAEPLNGDSYTLFAGIAKKFGVWLILPFFEKRAPGLYHNTLLVIGPKGETNAVYRKLHIPHDPGFSEKFYFTPGDTPIPTIRTRETCFSALICWDQWFPEAARLACLNGAELLFYPTAIGWSDGEPEREGRRQLSAWQTVQRAHAIANGMYVIAVNRVGRESETVFWGHSFVADPFGEIIFETDAEQEGAFVVELDLTEVAYYRERWPFLRDRRPDVYSPIAKRFND